MASSDGSSAIDPPGQRHVKLLQRVHEFSGDPDDEVGITFHRSVVVFERDDGIYVARIPEAIPLEGPFNLEGVTGVRVNLESVFPIFNSVNSDDFTSVAEPSLQNLYRKLPSLIEYEDKPYTDAVENTDSVEKKLMVREAQIYELLKKSPHDNVVMYYGCKVQNKRIVGFYLEKLEETLRQRLDRLGSNFDIDQCLRGTREGIRHIYSLGLCHNDLNPANIMFRKDSTPVIIDFDSSQPQGEKLALVVGTEGWYDPERELSAPQNDIDAFHQIKKHICSAVSTVKKNSS